MKGKLKIAIQAVFMILFFSFSFISCESEKYEYIAEPVDTTVVISFATDVMPIFNASCNTGCHKPSPSPDLSANNAYKALTSGTDMIDLATPENSIIYKRMIDASKPMPPAGLLSQKEANKILLWIQQGAQDN